MILGHGVDIVDIRRFRYMDKNRLLKLARRICTPSEFTEFMNHKKDFQYLAKIWACKEAVSKSFGTGITGNITWKNILISSDILGKPVVSFKESISRAVCHISISHEKDYLIASAILEVI
jgi:holo-[acyl-carrier protein] synthase